MPEGPVGCPLRRGMVDVACSCPTLYIFREAKSIWQGSSIAMSSKSACMALRCRSQNKTTTVVSLKDVEQKSLDWVEQIFQKQLWGQSTFKYMILSDVQWGEECSTDLNQFSKWLRQNLRYMQLLTGLDLDVQCDCGFA